VLRGDRVDASAALALAFAQAGDPRVSQALEDALRFVPRAGHPAPYGRWPTLNLVIEAVATAGRTEDAAALHAGAEEMLGLGFAIMWACEPLPRTTAVLPPRARAIGREPNNTTRPRSVKRTPGRSCQPIARY